MKIHEIVGTVILREEPQVVELTCENYVIISKHKNRSVGPRTPSTVPTYPGPSFNCGIHLANPLQDQSRLPAIAFGRHL